MITRKKVIERLVNFSLSPEELQHLLGGFPFDSDEQLAVLTRENLVDVLVRYVQGKITSDTIRKWARLIEGRSDVGFEDGRYGKARECLYELANPYLTEPLTRARAEYWIEWLKTSTGSNGG